ncbi:hypothetical protein BM280_18245 [Klebsiella michiganensis]|nr:hypothetical protein BM280_18245 [Klebsiella michiganensis]
MTDITALAQREKFEAWAEERCALPWGYLKNRRTNTGYFSKHDYTSLWAAWKAAGAELVEALEKAQQQTTESENRVRKQNRHICELFDDNTALRQRISELESRTVKLPEPEEWNIIQILLCKKKVIAAIRAAGIKVEAE